MTNDELQNLTEKWSLEKFARPFIHETYFNKRLRTTGGRYHLNDHHIDINPKMIDEFDVDNLEKVVLHELCHYHLHLMGMGYKHQDHDFKDLLVKVGGSKYAPATKQKPKKVVHYQCTSCWLIISRTRRINVNRYVCARCGGKIQLLDKVQK